MNETSIVILYASHDGHTRKIALRVAQQLMAAGSLVTLCDLGREQPDAGDLAESSTLVIMAPIRYGYHLPPVERFVMRNKALLADKKLALVSINLTARKQGKNTAAANPYFCKWIKRHKIEPDLRAVFAGRLEYALYRWWEKQMIRLIMFMTGGPTQFDAVVEYTDWRAVDAFANEVAALATEKKEAA